MTVPLKFGIIASVTAAVILALGIYCIFVTFFVNPYLTDNDKLPNLFDFYHQHGDTGTYKIYFLGSSQVREGLDARVVEDLRGSAHTNVEAYNLGYPADTPMRRLTELQPLLQSKPDLVVIGLSYHSFSHPDNIPLDHLVTVADEIVLDNASRELFTSDEQRIIDSNFVTLSYEKRIWVVPAIIGVLRKDPDAISNSHNFKNPYIYSRNQTIDELMAKFSQYPEEYITFPPGDNREKRALELTIQELQQSNIGVILVGMPINPLLTERISSSDRANLKSFLGSRGVTYIDMEDSFPQSDFIDFLHPNAAGRLNISRRISELILSQEIEHAL